MYTCIHVYMCALCSVCALYIAQFISVRVLLSPDLSLSSLSLPFRPDRRVPPEWRGTGGVGGGER